MDWTVITKIVVEHVLPILLSLLTTVLLVAGRHAIRWLQARLHLEESATAAQIEKLWRDLVHDGVAFAEQHSMLWARDRRKLLSGEQKLETALAFIEREARARGLPAMAQGRIRDWIESSIGDPRAPGRSDSGSIMRWNLSRDVTEKAP